MTQCELVKEEVKEQLPAEEEKTEEVTVVQPPVTEPTTPIITGEVITTPTLPATEEKSLFETSGFLIALIAGEVLLLLVAILIIVALFRKGKRD